LHGTTFGGGPLVCATALEFLTVVEEENLLTNIRERNEELREGLEAFAKHFDFIREVRGEGLMLGVDLDVEGAPFVRVALNRGLLVNSTHEHVLRLLPPFIIRRREVAEFLEKFESVLARAPKNALKPSTEGLKKETHAQPMVLAATR
jgi:acetylornithine/succinyldiaminopimelate/putrescine aminotransferase